MKPENTSGRTELGAAFSTFYALLSLGHYRYSPPLSGTTAFFNWARFWLSLSILDPTKTRPTGQCRPGEPDKDWQRGTTVGFWDQLDWKTAKQLECCQVLIYHHLAAILWILNWGMFFKLTASIFVRSAPGGSNKMCNGIRRIPLCYIGKLRFSLASSCQALVRRLVRKIILPLPLLLPVNQEFCYSFQMLGNRFHLTGSTGEFDRKLLCFPFG